MAFSVPFRDLINSSVVYVYGGKLILINLALIIV